MEEGKESCYGECPSPASNQFNGNEASPVKEYYCEQREALPGEPRCAVCARYGEYICNETDDDVCSRQCKQILLQRLAKLKKPFHVTPSIKVPAQDECIYVRDGDISGAVYLTIDQVESLRNEVNIQVKGESVPPLVLSFSTCNLPQKLQENLEKSGYEMPTPVQMQAIPTALSSKNMLVSAETGSGKTASFLIPIVSHCSNIRLQHPSDEKRPLAMVLAPTRELCMQVEEQAKVLGEGLPFKTALVIGGDAMASQVYRIQQGVELIIGTPGRLIDLLAKNDIELEEVSTLVLDEVDCMLQKGFRDQVMQIFLALTQPQMLMFSATVPQEVEKMANAMAKDVIFISVGKPSRANESVKQVAIWVEPKQKKQKLFEILTSKQHFKPPVVVFVSSRLGAELLSEAITIVTGVKAQSIHGEKTMKERRESLRLFLTGEVPVIVATGILGRGVDLLRVRQVIIFDMPNSMKEYVHQIGRASRMGEEGMAIVFVNEEDKNLFKELIENLRSVGASVPRELANSRYSGGYYPSGRGRRKRKHRS